jgi:hypothetical protein
VEGYRNKFLYAFIKNDQSLFFQLNISSRYHPKL